MHKSDVERRAEMVATVAQVNTALSSRFGRKYVAVLYTTPGALDKIVIERHTESTEQESVGVERTP